MVFQQFNLFPHMTVERNITLAPIEVRGIGKEAAHTRRRELLERVGIPEKARRLPGRPLAAASSSAWRSPARWRWTPSSCSSTSRPRRWTRR